VTPALKRRVFPFTAIVGQEYMKLALLLNVLLRLSWIQGVQQFMHQHLELLAATHAGVKDDSRVLRLLRERVPVGSTLKRRKTQQPPLVAVQRKNVIVCHGSPFQAPP
jgi:hypothetical protein